jgi:hypothetical protein
MGMTYNYVAGFASSVSILSLYPQLDFCERNQAFQVRVCPIKKDSLYALRFAARKPAAQGQERVLSIPSTYEPTWAQELRPGWLDVLGYSLSPLRGWCLARLTVTAPTFIPLGAQATSTLEYSYRSFTLMSTPEECRQLRWLVVSKIHAVRVLEAISKI